MLHNEKNRKTNITLNHNEIHVLSGLLSLVERGEVESRDVVESTIQKIRLKLDLAHIEVIDNEWNSSDYSSVLCGLFNY